MSSSKHPFGGQRSASSSRCRTWRRGGPFQPAVGLSGTLPLAGDPSGGALPFVCSPFGFNFHTSLVSRGVVKKAAPSPILGTNAQSFADRVAGNVAELLDELTAVPDVGGVVSLLPKVFGRADQTPRHALFERLNRRRECFLVRLGKQEANMLGHDHIAHDHIAIDTELKIAPDAFQSQFEALFAGIGEEQLTAAITAKGDEVSLPGDGSASVRMA